MLYGGEGADTRGGADTEEEAVKLAGFDLVGPFFDPYEVKDLPGVYVVLSVEVLDVGEAGWGRQGMSRRLRNHSRRRCWEEHRGEEHRLAFAVL